MEEKKYWNIYHVYELINPETEKLETVQQCVFIIYATEYEIRKFVADQNNIKVINTDVGPLHYHGVNAEEIKVFELEDITYSLLEYAFNIRIEKLDEEESEAEDEDIEFKIEEVKESEEVEDSEESEEVEDFEDFEEESESEDIKFSNEEERSCESC